MSIFTSCEEGDLDALLHYLEKNGDPNAADKEGWTLLMLSCASGNTNLVAKLLEFPVDIHVRNKYGATAIISAAWNDDPEMVRLLLDKGANPNDTDEDGISPLMQAMDSRSEENIDLLIQHGANPHHIAKDGSSTLYRAAEKGSCYGIIKMLQQGVDAYARDENNWDALYAAIVWDKADAVKVLLDNKINPNLLYDDHYSTLICASSEGKIEIVKHLLVFGAAIDHSDQYGYTSLMRAALNGHDQVCKLLIENGADPDIINDSRETALDIARKEKYKAVVKILEPKTKRVTETEVKEPVRSSKKELKSGDTFNAFKTKFRNFSFPSQFETLCDLWDQESILSGSIELDVEAQDSLITWFGNSKLNDKFIAFAIDGIHSLYAFTNQKDPVILYLSGEGEGSCVLASDIKEFLNILKSGKEYSPFDKQFFDLEESPNELLAIHFPDKTGKKFNPDKIRANAIMKNKALQDWIDNYKR